MSGKENGPAMRRYNEAGPCATYAGARNGAMTSLFYGETCVTKYAKRKWPAHAYPIHQLQRRKWKYAGALVGPE